MNGFIGFLLQLHTWNNVFDTSTIQLPSEFSSTDGFSHHSSTAFPESECESYVTTDGLSASLSWNKAPIWGLRPGFYYSWQLRVCWCGALSLTRGRVCRLQLLLALASAFILGSESLSQIRDFPFRRLLRLAGRRWRYSTPPQHGIAFPGLVWSPFLALGEKIEITASKGSISALHESVVSEACMIRCLAKWVVPCLAPLFRLLGGVYRIVA
jgi:hypothetical protein